MLDEQPHVSVRCDWEPCHKRLVDFCFVCAESDKFYCDEICASRDQQDRRASQHVTLQ